MTIPQHPISEDRPIGMFDSGLGGISIWKDVTNHLPHESVVYLADSVNAPYGEKSREEIIQFSIKNTELLLEKNCKLIIVACNTATTNAISYLRENYPVPFIGIEPATKTATERTQSGKIGVLATKGTLLSDLYNQTSNKYGSNHDIIEMEGKGLVRLIEDGKLEETKPLLKEYLTPMIDGGVDCIVLGCTHYPFLTPIIKSMVPEHVQILDTGLAVARQAQRILQDEQLLNQSDASGNYQFYTNNDLEILNSFLKRVNAKGYESGYLGF